MRKTKIALLLCDTPMPAVVNQSGDYTRIFTTLMARANPEFEFELDPFDVVRQMKYPSQDDMDKGVYEAVMYTGSAASAYENLEWINRLVDWTKSIYDHHTNVKLIGICFGHQIIGRALGGTCAPNEGKWEVGPTKVDLNAAGKKVFGLDQIVIHQMHRDHVPQVPGNALLLGSTAVCMNQGMVVYTPESLQKAEKDRNLEDIRIFTVQGHPEFTREIVDKIVEARSRSGIIDTDTAKDYESRKDWNQDGVDIAKIIWKVLGYKCST